MHTFDDLIGIIAELRSDHGCPWDKEQTFESLKKCLADEAQEVFEAVDKSMFEGFRPEETRQACGYLMRMLHNLRGDLPPERMNCQC